jgi:hypothetical protein
VATQLKRHGGFVDRDSDLYKPHHPAYTALMGQDDTLMAAYTRADGRAWMAQAEQYVLYATSPAGIHTRLQALNAATRQPELAVFLRDVPVLAATMTDLLQHGPTAPVWHPVTDPDQWLCLKRSAVNPRLPAALPSWPMGRRWSGDLRRCDVSRFPTKSGGVSAAESGWVLLNASLTRPGTVRGARSESQARSSPRVVE